MPGNEDAKQIDDVMQLDRLLLPAQSIFDPGTALPGTHSPGLIGLSVFIAILAATVALSTAERVSSAGSTGGRAAWLVAGGGCMGGGIWGMHFVGMLAFSLPCGITYDPLVTLGSMIPGMIASGTALWVISRGNSARAGSLIGGACLMGAGIGAMHYSGMAAMRLPATLHYDAVMVGISVIVAVVLAFISLSSLFMLRRSAVLRPLAIPLAATIMGCSVAGMHYTAMQAALFFPLPGEQAVISAFDPTVMAVVIALLIVCFGIATLAASFAGRQFDTAVHLREEMTRRATLEQEARAGHARLQSIIDNVQEAIITIEDSGTVVHWSPGATTIFGYTAEEVIGRNVTLIMPAEVARDHHAHIGAYLSTGNAKIIGIGREVEGRRRDGSSVPLELNISRAEVDGRILFTGILRDVTERKRILDELIGAREQADAASRAKSMFLANMSHEIRTPLNPIIGMAHLLQKTDLDRLQAEYARKIHQSGRHLLKIINDILDFSKIEAGQLTLEQTAFDLDEVLESIASVVSERASAQGLELVFDVPMDIPRHYCGDPLRLSQILINFANNAVKFTEAGEIEVSVALLEDTADTVRLRFTVRDTGIGITEEQQSRLFQSFQQADESTTRRFGGTGLGLAISRRLADLMAGEVGMDSVFGEGSRFWLDVPLKKSSKDSSALLPEPTLRGCRALVVEDNPSARHALCDMLSSMTFSVDASASGQEAIEQIRANPGYDAVFVDWRMPGMDGIQTIRTMKGLAMDGPDPAYVLVTAYGREDVLREAETADVDDILIKPLNPSQLFDSVVRVLRHRAGIVEEAAAVRSEAVPNERLTMEGRQVLVVEDNDLNREVAIDLLKAVGLGVDTVENGALALDALAKGSYDAVLMDVQMPVMDGYSATREYRRREPDSDLPIIAMTANAMSGDRERCLEAGMNDHVAKPIDPDDLYAVLSRWLGAAPAADPAAQPADGVRTIPDVHPMVDAEAGLRRVLGRRDRYIEMLRRYADGQADAADRIARLVAAGDWAAAEREAHTARAVAGNIGATEIAVRAEEIEKAIQSSRPASEIAPRIDTLRSLIQSVLEGIYALPELSAAPDDSSSKLSAEEINGFLARLQKLLEDDDAEALDLLAAEGPPIRASLGDQYFTPLAKAVQAFDFESARRLCAQAAAAQREGVTS